MFSLAPWDYSPGTAAGQHRAEDGDADAGARRLADPGMSGPGSSVRAMNRTDRLYALVEELRAVAPRSRSARQLAGRYEVSTRTIERDILALQESGVPIYAGTGRRGGYAIDKTLTLPPLNFTAAEMVAIAVSLAREEHTPFAAATRSALRKVLATASAAQTAEAGELMDRVRLIGAARPGEPARRPQLQERAGQERAGRSGPVPARELACPGRACPGRACPGRARPGAGRPAVGPAARRHRPAGHPGGDHRPARAPDHLPGSARPGDGPATSSRSRSPPPAPSGT